ncbi:MAG: HNH endonuclease [Acidobacteriota bacterium]|jgi:5-methylcytosine-specific restriction endonuclease McrA|nr:HNH endonuclease [Acidobacteriota bacterium]
MLDSHVLVLNRVFQAVQVTSVRKAFTLFYKGHVRAVLPDYSTWDFDNWCDIPVQPHDEVVLTPSSAIRIPRVVALKEFDRLPRQDVKFSRHNIYVRDGSRCQYCGHKFPSADLSLDHVIPLSRGGTSNWENVVCACLSCNVRKGNRTPHEASMRLIQQPKKPRWHPVGHFGASKFHPAWRNFLDVAYWNMELK